MTSALSQAQAENAKLKAENEQLRNNQPAAKTIPEAVCDLEANDPDEIQSPSGTLQLDVKWDICICFAATNGLASAAALEKSIIQNEKNLKITSLSCPIWRKRTFDSADAEAKVARY